MCVSANAGTGAYGVPARLHSVSMQPPTSRPVTSTGPSPSSRCQPPVPVREYAVARGFSVQSQWLCPCTPGEDWVNVDPVGRAATSSHDSRGFGTSYGVSIKLLPCRVAIPVRRVIGVISVAMSENPTNQVGSAAAIASRSSSGSRSMAVSPPHGGMTARTSGSVSMAISSSAR